MNEFGFELQQIPEISKRLQAFIKKRQDWLTPNLFSPAEALTGMLKPLLDLLGNLKLEFRPSVAHGEDTPQFVLEPNPYLPLLGIAKALEDSNRRALTGLANYGKALQYMSRFDVQAATAIRKACTVTSFTKKPPGAWFPTSFPGRVFLQISGALWKLTFLWGHIPINDEQRRTHPTRGRFGREDPWVVPNDPRSNPHHRAPANAYKHSRGKAPTTRDTPRGDRGGPTGTRCSEFQEPKLYVTLGRNNRNIVSQPPSERNGPKDHAHPHWPTSPWQGVTWISAQFNFLRIVGKIIFRFFEIFPFHGNNKNFQKIIFGKNFFCGKIFFSSQKIFFFFKRKNEKIIFMFFLIQEKFSEKIFFFFQEWKLIFQKN